MAAVNNIGDSLRYVVARAAQQATSAIATSSPTATPSSTVSPPQTTTSASPSTSSSASGGGSGGGSSSPLLFFVALGFGVVFTNLWIIVGVKYCFRYNARNRALRNAEGAEPITLDNMPARPHRRRREKKLMTMDEVNDRFPLAKYKNWVATRASEGLPTAGGVSGTAPPSRAPSVKHAEGVAPVSSADQTEAILTATAAATGDVGEAADKRKSMEASTVEKEPTSPDVDHFGLKEVQTSESANRDGDEDDDDDDEHIHTALPPELLANPGDSCAICIDVLEQDDDVRGLTCGHAFHAGCLDPWLTSRRACCPLCKADYYIPKPRPEVEATAEAERTGRRPRVPQPPPPMWSGLRPSRMGLPGRFIVAGYPGDGVSYGARESRQDQRARRAAAAAAGADNASNAATQGDAPEPAAAATPAPSRWRPRISNPFRSITIPGRNRTATDGAAAEATEPSPSQLEAGVPR